MIRLFSSFDLFFYNFSSFFFFILFLFLRHFFWLSRTTLHFFGVFSSFILSFLKRLLEFKFKFFDATLFSLIIFLCFINFFSVLPYFFPYSSQLSFNLFWGLSLWGSLFLYGVFYNVKHVLSHFIPEGSPFSLIWFLFLVELISNIIRPLTLVVRLLANILAGHLLIILLSKLVFLLSAFGLLYLVLNLVEFAVSVIQSYIFVTILCLYFSEVK